MTLHIHTIQTGAACAYLIESDAGVILVDTGLPHAEQRILRQMHALGCANLRAIFITHAHPDHYGSAAALRQHTGAPIVIHKADAAEMAAGALHLGTAHGRGKLLKPLLPLWSLAVHLEPTPADLCLEDGEQLPIPGITASVLHTPGHTPGSSCLLIEGHAFAGDLISTTGSPHVQRFFADDWSALPASLQRLQAQHPDWTYAGHGQQPVDKATLLALKVTNNRTF